MSSGVKLDYDEPELISNPDEISDDDLHDLSVSTVSDSVEENSELVKSGVLTKRAGRRELFQFATRKDKMLMGLGFLMLLLGSLVPIAFAVIFGDLIDYYDDLYSLNVPEFGCPSDVYAILVEYNYSPEDISDMMKKIENANLTGPGEVFANCDSNHASSSDGNSSLSSDGNGSFQNGQFKGGANVTGDKEIANKLIEEIENYVIRQREKEFEDKINLTCKRIIILAAIAFVTSFGMNASFRLAAARQTRKLFSAYFRAVISQDMHWVDGGKLDDVPGLIMDHCALFSSLVDDSLASFIQGLVILFFCFVYSLYTKVIMALVMSSLIPPTIAVLTFLARKLAGSADRINHNLGEVGGSSEFLMNSINTVVAFSGQSKACELYNDKVQGIYSEETKKAHIKGFMDGAVSFSTWATFTLSFAFGAFKISQDDMTSGEVISIFVSFVVALLIAGSRTTEFLSPIWTFNVCFDALFRNYWLMPGDRLFQ